MVKAFQTPIECPFTDFDDATWGSDEDKARMKKSRNRRIRSTQILFNHQDGIEH